MGDGLRGWIAFVFLATTVWGQQGLRHRAQGEARVAAVRDVVVDVVVTDAKGVAVTGLTAADLRVTEDGVTQAIGSVVERGVAERAGARVVLAPHVYTNKPLVFGSGATTVILIDRADSSGVGLADLQPKLQGYLKHVPAGTALAIFTLDTDLHTVMEMTDDPARFAAVGAAIGDPMPTFLLGDPFMSDVARDGMRQELLRQAMAKLAGYWSAYPGRKNLLWVTGDVPVALTDESFADDVAMQEDGGRVSETVTLNRVAVYPIEVRASLLSMASGRGPGTTAAMGDVIYTHSLDERHRAMEAMAARTGGVAFRENGPVKNPFLAAATMGSHFYTVTYRSSGPAGVGTHRTLQVTAVRAGVTVGTRAGYVVRGVGEEDKAPMSEAHGHVLMQGALRQHGVPEQAMVFRAVVEPTGGVLRDAKGQAGRPGDALAVKVRQKGYRMVRVEYSVEPQGMRFTQAADGRFRHRLEVYAMLYDEQGVLVNSRRSLVSEGLEPREHEAVMRDGMHFVQTIAVPAKGRFGMRLAVFDPDGPVMGTLDVPALSVQE